MKGSGNVVVDDLNRYLEETGLSYDHLLPDEHGMDLVCAHFFNLSSGLSMDDFRSLLHDDTVPHVDVSLKGNGADLLDSSTTPRAYSKNILEDLTLTLDSLRHFHNTPGMFVILRFRIFLSGMVCCTF